jgi:hypothetical protein
VPNLQDGRYYLGAILDIHNHVDEKDESNNAPYRSDSITLSHPGVPDLEPTSLSLSSTRWIVGNQITASLTEKTLAMPVPEIMKVNSICQPIPTSQHQIPRLEMPSLFLPSAQAGSPQKVLHLLYLQNHPVHTILVL